MKISIIRILSLLVIFNICSVFTANAEENEIHSVVEEIVSNAETNNIEYFMELQDRPNEIVAQRLIEMINNSDMLSNYKTRLTINDGRGNLNYHYLEKGCHFQVSLEFLEGEWMVTRIYICR